MREHQVSWGWMGRFKWLMAAEGMMIDVPGGNSITRPHSQRIRWPPCIESNFLALVITQTLKVRFPPSVCQQHQVASPKLNSITAQALLGKRHSRHSSCMYRAPRAL